MLERFQSVLLLGTISSFTCLPINISKRRSSRAHAPPKLKVKVLHATSRLDASHHLEETPSLQTNNNNNNDDITSHQSHIYDSSTSKKSHHVRSNPPHHRPLPRAILPPDRPHPRQSAPDPWRASNNRRRRSSQRFLEPRKFLKENTFPRKKSTTTIVDLMCKARITNTTHANFPLRYTGRTPPTQPRGRNHRQGAKRPERAGDGEHGSGA
jgi:hypothetical protein